MGVDFTPDPTLYPFGSHWFDSTRGRMHYIDEGSGQPILFCHGNPTWSFLYRDVVVALRDRFRCIAPDYLGFGLSERPTGFGYTAEEHASVVGELVDHLGLDDYLTMGQDWGGPISMADGVQRADRIRGVILGNTWLWPADDLTTRAFSKVMSSAVMQYAIMQRNFFVERLIPAGTARKPSAEVMAHYRGVQPGPRDRAGVARMPKDILAARPLLERLAREVPVMLGSKPALL
ncbi:MAG: alpha/beta fold hydrolase, partial [Mycobacterium sp.]